MPDRYLTTDTIPLRWLAKDSAGVPLTGKSDLEMAIRRDSDGEWFDFDGSNRFEATPTTQWTPLTEVDATSLPGLYELLWNHALVVNAADDDACLVSFRQNGGTDAVVPPPGEIAINQWPGAILENTETLLNSDAANNATGGTTTHPLQDTVRLYMDLVLAGAGAIGQTPTMAIQRVADGKWFQASDETWQTTIVENSMIQLDSVNLPGRYYLDFDQDKDDLAESNRYLVKKTNIGTPKLIEYLNLLFGAQGRATQPRLCSVQGSVYTAQGEPQQNLLVRATLVPVFSDAVGRGVLADTVVGTYTNDQGEFSLQLVRGGIFRLEVDAIGYDRKVTVPDQSSVLFTDL